MTLILRAWRAAPLSLALCLFAVEAHAGESFIEREVAHLRGNVRPQEEVHAELHGVSFATLGAGFPRRAQGADEVGPVPGVGAAVVGQADAVGKAAETRGEFLLHLQPLRICLNYPYELADANQSLI